MTHSLIFDSCLPHGQAMNTSFTYIYKNPKVGTHSVVRTLFSIATQYTSYSILKTLVFAEYYSLSISELEQNLHDCRQLPITWTLLEVVTKVLTTSLLVCFSATNLEPLNNVSLFTRKRNIWLLLRTRARQLRTE